MGGKIFVIDSNEALRELVEAPYASEDLLQQLLAKYPDLLSGDQIDRDTPRRFLLVSREVEVPDCEAGPGRWALDHLFLDQDGVPTLVEVKRSSDTRLRREVVGQMLDYAANGLAYWPLERLRAVFEADCLRRGVAAEQRLVEHLRETGRDVESFWQEVKKNLQAGCVRLVFLADVIPPELQRVVEFLNGQMDPAEVLAIAVRQYEGSGIRTLVPQVYGQTAGAQARKSGSGTDGHWDEPAFFASLKQRGDSEYGVGRQVWEWCARHLPEERWGRGSTIGSCSRSTTIRGIRYAPFAVWTTGEIELLFRAIAERPPFDRDEMRQELLHRLLAVPGVSLPENAFTRQPSLKMAALAHGDAVPKLLQVFEWYLDATRRHAIAAAAGTAADSQALVP